MAKQKIYQQRVLKLTSDYILWNKKDIHLTMSQARDEQKLIPLFDSNAIRMIDLINEFERDEAIKNMDSLKKQLKYIKKQPKSNENRRKISEIYSQMDDIQCKMDYVAVVLNNDKDFDLINDGFKINGIEYHRLIGTPNGVKKSTIIYCSINNQNHKQMYEELSRRFNNGRDLNKKLVPAKFEAHKALTCSASSPVSTPNGILVVDDLEVCFKDKVITLNDKDTSEPVLEFVDDADVNLNASDGYGMMCPALAERWSKEMGVHYIAGTMCIRNSFCKGITATFDFHDFARQYSKSPYVTDVWGNTYNINDIELILTTSMLKLWSSYASIEDYLQKCVENGYTFGVTKVYPCQLEDERNLNYQFIQSYNLSDDDIRQLIYPTVSEIKDVLHNDYYKTLLFLKGAVDKNFEYNDEENIISKALMVSPEVVQDSYIVNIINNMIKKKITNAKIGTLKISGNYCVVVGDLFALCQKIFNLVDNDADYGLLKRNEIYNKHWIDKDVNKIVCFRSPMSCHNNIRVVNVVHNDLMDYWYQYLPAVNIINCHDTLCHACNGMDMDGDCLITTDNEILLNNTRTLPAIMCEQRKAQSKVITEEELVIANKNSFGDAIGSTTNKITAMYDVMSKYSPDSKEYKVLEYRIMCGQLYQQNAIDATKGIIAKPMPISWYNYQANNSSDKDTVEEKEKKDFNKTILADKKPYFMNYIYPQQMSQYKKYIENADIQSKMLYRLSINELIQKQDKTEDEANFVNWYLKKMPVGVNDCVMNRLCWMVEDEFDGYVDVLKSIEFDTTIYKCGVEYKESTKKEVMKLYKEFTKELQQIVIKSKQTRLDEEQVAMQKNALVENYRRKCTLACANENELCDILIDVCYNKNNSKKFVWDICGNQIIQNLLAFKDNKYTYCVKDDDGDIQYAGKTYKAITKELIVE